MLNNLEHHLDAQPQHIVLPIGCSFTSKECKVSKTFGDASTKVLFVFDGQQAPDMNSLIAKVGAAGAR
jgi:hypothetical protein